jgi:hypothetical protein
MNVSGITAALPAQDLSRAEAFYLEKVGPEAVQSSFLNASDGRLGVVVGDAVNQIVLYPAEAKSSGQFLQAVLQVSDVRAVVEEMSGRGVRFEEYDTAETHGERYCPGARWSPSSVVQGLRRQPGRRRKHPGWLGTGEPG